MDYLIVRAMYKADINREKPGVSWLGPMRCMGLCPCTIFRLVVLIAEADLGRRADLKLEDFCELNALIGRSP